MPHPQEDYKHLELLLRQQHFVVYWTAKSYCCMVVQIQQALHKPGDDEAVVVVIVGHKLGSRRLALALDQYLLQPQGVEYRQIDVDVVVVVVGVTCNPDPEPLVVVVPLVVQGRYYRIFQF